MPKQQIWMWYNEGTSEGGTESSEKDARKAAAESFRDAGYSDQDGYNVFVGPVTARGTPRQDMEWTYE